MARPIPPQPAEVYLEIGAIYFGQAGTRITTLLGSCVALTFWHPTLRVGGMCHCLLPSRRNGQPPLDGKYVDEAVQLLLNAMAKCRRPVSEYQVKLFGAGNMFPSIVGSGPQVDVAGRNAEAAREKAASLGLQIVAEDTGGWGHRKVVFDLASGHVWVRHERINNRRMK
ncbi:chemotaxis protein CheD [Pseudomonas sp. B2M1-30]|uniref:chemotaxis protein CheD n=1 Tax=Pseudomonas TaxID=286 RepID=UPI001C3DF5D9|nr:MULTISPECIES: chemotaxis protein CheD [Pseudomonas]MBV4473605.1 chemotaxis protein CheD [Pseudomonas botevensis]MCU0117745.1 chemotaxis protein CheD [Pseudomonas sp. B2M1-30]MCU7259281.1 chemotaxis protein CheD [Pseudomonas koreensis]